VLPRDPRSTGDAWKCSQQSWHWCHTVFYQPLRNALTHTAHAWRNKASSPQLKDVLAGGHSSCALLRRMRQQQVAAQQRFRAQQRTPPPAPSSYAGDSRMAPAPYAPVAALQPYPTGPRGPGTTPPLHPAMGGPQFVAGTAMGPISAGIRGPGGPPMRRAPPSAGHQPQHQPQQMQLQQPHPTYGAGGQSAFSMQEYAAGPTAMVSAYGMGAPGSLCCTPSQPSRWNVKMSLCGPSRTLHRSLLAAKLSAFAAAERSPSVCRLAAPNCTTLALTVRCPSLRRCDLAHCRPSSVAGVHAA